MIVLKVTRIAPKHEGRKLKVAAYCRVSTDKSSQEESLESQQRTYEAMIRGNPKRSANETARSAPREEKQLPY